MKQGPNLYFHSAGHINRIHYNTIFSRYIDLYMWIYFVTRIEPVLTDTRLQ